VALSEYRQSTAPPTAVGGQRKRTRRTVTTIVRHALLILLSLLFLTPFVWMVSTSLKTNEQVVEWPPRWIPNPLQPSNYSGVFETVPLLTYAKNTLIVTLFSVIGAVVSNALVAYGFARIQWRGREVLFIITLGTLMLPFQVTMIPLFIMFTKMGWVNTFFPLIVPSFLGNAFYIFLLRQVYLGISENYSEAARIEGASDLQILWYVIVPLARPALLSIALFQYLASWNDFLGPLLYLNDESKFTLALGLANMQSALGLSDFGQIMAAATMILIPVIGVFMFTQRYFLEGIAASGLKG
jgi:multiple sugar transport system permease protein